MLASNLVDIALHCTYQTDHGLQTSITPAMLVPACAKCFAACPRGSITCGSCRGHVCGKCAERHALSKITCSTCGGHQDSRSSTSSEWSVSSDSVYHFLRECWQCASTARLKDGYWVTMARLDGFISAPAKDVGTWMVVSLKLASRYPRGVVVFDLDGQKCIVCAPGQAPAQANVSSALSWIRRLGDATIGIAVHDASFACLSVHRDRKVGCIEEHRSVLNNVALGLSFVEF